MAFKTRGCNLLSKFLIPIRECRSDLLRRTNLSSVFDDALTPCLLSIPTITPEDESLQLLGAAYPTLLSVLQTRYRRYPSDRDKEQSSQDEENKTAYVSHVASILRNNVIPSFHHVSSTAPSTAAAASSLASFPYPRLSAFLLKQMVAFTSELGIHTTKYLQELIPPIYSTLTNPFGTGYPPLLLAGIAAARAVILNAHPRIWRFRGELLGAFCDCWVHVRDEEKNQAEVEARARARTSISISTNNTTTPSKESEETLIFALTKLKKQLKGAVYLLKIAVEAVATTTSEAGEEANWTGILLEEVREGETVNIAKECEDLVRADEELRELLFGEVPDFDNDDVGHDDGHDYDEYF